MRAQLQTLIDYTGLSIGEAAAIIGIGHDALGRKLAGRERYDARASDIEPLQVIADYQDKAVGAISRMVLSDVGEGDYSAITLYRRDEDMPAGERWPASVGRMIAARLQRAMPDKIKPVVFDPANYFGWLGDRADNQQARAEWAGMEAQKGLRLSAKIGVEKTDNDKVRDVAVGWALWQVGTQNPPVETGTLDMEG